MKTNLTSCDDCPSKKQGIFCDASDNLLHSVSKHKVTNNYKKGQTLFVQGNHPYGIFCISKGNIKLTKTNPEGRESIIRLVSAGDVLGHRSLFTNKQFEATATAIEDTTVCFLDKKFILKVIQENPDVSMHLIEKLSRDMGAAEKKLSSVHQKSVRERLAELLLLLKESHGEELPDGRIKINLKLTREEMSSMIGTANETLIRFISEFKDEGLIDQDGKFIIVNDEEKILEWSGAQL